MAQDAGVTIVLESDPSVNGHTAVELGELIDCIDHPAVQALFDGGNYPFSPDAQTPLASYAVLRERIRHVHVKDALRENGSARAVCIGTGEGQVRETLAALRKDGYDGWLSWKPTTALTRCWTMRRCACRAAQRSLPALPQPARSPCAH